jgi:hypothetical protein
LYWQPLDGGTTGPPSSPKEPLLPPPLLLPLPLPPPPLLPLLPELPPLLLELPGFVNPVSGVDDEHAAMATTREATLTMREGFMGEVLLLADGVLEARHPSVSRSARFRGSS